MGDRSEVAEYEIDEQILLTLSRSLYRTEGHPLLIGDRGIGKTTILQDFARRVSSGEFPHLTNRSILWIDCSQIPSSDAEPFFSGMLQNLQHDPTAIWCLDRFGHLLKTPDGRSLKSLLLSLLNNSGSKLIGVLSREEFVDQISQDADLLRAFNRIDIEEPDETKSLNILSHHAESFVADFELEITPEVVERTVSLTSNFMLSDRHPAKSIRVLKQVCEDLHFDRTQLGLDCHAVATSDIEHAVANETGIPVETISGDTTTSEYASTLREAVVGQDEVLSEIDRELRLIKAGLNEPAKPASVMLFAGMTGVGKTELAKRIAEIYSSSRRLNTYTMANFTEPHSVSGIIGVPPGYVGFENGGRLINELNADPYSVFLLDEAEKAHPNVWKPFLNLFDEGWIVDQRGVKAYADRAIFILTTNAGDRNIAQMSKSDKPHEEIVDFVKQALSKVRHERVSQPVFPPAFLARIGRVVVFKPLDEQAMTGIAERVCKRMQKLWLEKRGKRIEIDKDVIQALGQKAHQLNESANGREGGRIVKKLVKDHIEVKTQDAASNNDEQFRSCQAVLVSRRDSSEDNQELEFVIQFDSKPSEKHSSPLIGAEND